MRSLTFGMVSLVMAMKITLSTTVRIRKVWDCSSGICTCKEVSPNGNKIITVPPPPGSPTTTTTSTTPTITTKTTPKPNPAMLCDPTLFELCWTYYAHKTNATGILFQSKNQLVLSDFVYDGTDPQAYWSVHLGAKTSSSSPLAPCADYTNNKIMQTHEHSCEHVDPHNGEEITLTLPTGIEWKDVDWIGIYSYKDGHLFGYVKIPASLPFLSDNPDPPLGDCTVPVFPKTDFVKCDSSNTFKITRPNGTIEFHP